ncbi:MAG: hypothetical protein K6C10_03560 [Prevotella sp.]|nr:hypothetical protein [Prevotella sp.]
MKKVIYSMLALFCAAFTFTSCEDVPMPYDQPGEGGEETVVIEPDGLGTAESPFNVAGVLEYVNLLSADEESSEDIYFKGIVSSIVTNYDESGTYGNAVFYVSDDGTGKNTFYVYRALYLGNKKYTNGTILQEGDTVVVCGKLVNYKGTTPETVQSKAFLYSLNGETKGGGGGGSSTAIEVNCTKAVELTNALGDNDTSSDTYAVTGYITEVVGSVSKNQQTFWMADTKDGGRVFEAYWANLPEGVSEFKAGSKVKITGNLTKYVNNGKVTAEIKNATVEILEQGGGDDTPSGDAKKVTIAEFNAAAESTSVWYQLTGQVKNLNDGDQYGNFDLVDETGSVYVYGLLSEKGGEKKKFQELVAAQGITEGCTITIIGNRGSYNGKIEVTNAYFVSMGEGGGGGGDSSGNVNKSVDGNVVTLIVPNTTEGDKVTVDLNAQGWTSGKAVDPATITLDDGTKITFAKGDGSNTPAYYEATKGVRIYAKNTVTISGKAVAKVVLNCDTYNGTDYVGNSTLYANASGTTLTICNEHSEAKGGTQLRVQTIEITYAK